MPPDAPTTVTGRADARLHLSETRQVCCPTLLSYDATDPYAVTATLFVGQEGEAEWVFAREVLAAGLYEQAGAGDVLLRPTTETTDAVELVLSVRDDNARLTMPADSLAAFLHASHQVVPPGTEGCHLNLDATIQRLLSA